MTAAELHEAILLRRAVGACRERGRLLVIGVDGGAAHGSPENKLDVRGYPDIVSLLRDLGKSVPSPADVGREIRAAVGWGEPTGAGEGS